MFSTIKELEAAQLKDQLDQGKPIRLIDVRSLEEMAAGMIPNAEKLPLHTLPLRLSDLSNDEYCVLYCRSGARSAQGVGFLMAQGFENVYNLRGGIIAWVRMGLPLAS